MEKTNYDILEYPLEMCENIMRVDEMGKIMTFWNTPLKCAKNNGKMNEHIEHIEKFVQKGIDKVCRSRVGFCTHARTHAQHSGLTVSFLCLTAARHMELHIIQTLLHRGCHIFEMDNHRI